MRRYQVRDTQLDKILFESDNYKLVCTVALLCIDAYEKALKKECTYIGVCDTHGTNPDRFISMVM